MEEFDESEQRIIENMAADYQQVAHEQGENADDQEQVVVFELHDQYFCVDIQNVMEVKKIPEVTDVFHTPEFVVGVVNLRGDIIALLDIGLFFGLSETELSEDKKMVIIQDGPKDAGILADAMAGVQWIDLDNLQPAPPTVEGVSSEWVQGIVQKDNEPPMTFLDITAIFNSDRVQNL